MSLRAILDRHTKIRVQDSTPLSEIIRANQAAWLASHKAPEPIPEAHPHKKSRPRKKGPTKRQFQVALLIARDFSNKQMAAHLGLSVKTIEKHREAVMEKLGCHSVCALTHWAIGHGHVQIILPPNESGSPEHKTVSGPASDRERLHVPPTQAGPA